MASTLAFLLLFGLANCQTKSLQCEDVSSVTTDLPTVYHTNMWPIQTPPLSTVYRDIITKYLNVVDCDYVAVENVDHNYPQLGEYTEKTTSSTLTVYHVGCMTEVSTVTRRDIPNQRDGHVLQARTTQPITPLDHVAYHPQRSEASEQESLAAIYDIANRLSTGIDPNNPNITYRDFKFLVQINTALFALNIVISGLPLNTTCLELQTPTVQLSMEENYINAKQASDIVCFASVFGLFFKESNEEVLAQLAMLEYAIQAQVYGSVAPTDICQRLDYIAASFLGIDTDGIRTYVCNSTGPPAHPPAVNASTTVTSVTGPKPTGMTGTSPFTIPTTSGVSGTVSIVFGTSGSEASSATSAAGTVPIWWNATMPTVSETAPLTSGASEALPTTSMITPHYYPPMLRHRVRAGQ